MEIDDYMLLIGKQIKQAGDRGDEDEAIRLFNLLKDVANEQILKIEQRQETRK